MSDDFEKLEKLIQKEEQLGDQCTAFIFEECECASEPTERRNKATTSSMIVGRKRKRLFVGSSLPIRP
jgi:hypothetical protein